MMTSILEISLWEHHLKHSPLFPIPVAQTCGSLAQTVILKLAKDTRRLESLNINLTKKASSTFQEDGTYFSIQYGSGYCSGNLGVDVLQFAGLTVQEQKFGIATTIADVFGYQPVDGIMGLGWPNLAVDKVTPPMQNVLSQLDQPIFTVWMDRKKVVSEGSSGGIITYGALDPTHCEGSPVYVSLSSKTYWQFPIQGFSMGTYSENKVQQVISDTGTSWIGGPNTYITKIAAQAGGSYDWYYQLYTVDCSMMDSDKPLVFHIDGKDYSIPSYEYILDLDLGNNKCGLTFFDMTGGGFSPSWILGDTFIRTFCNVHDIGNGRIGFQKAIHSL